MADDSSGLTLADFQPIDPATGQVVVQKAAPANSNQPVDMRGIAPDMTTQDPDTFAALTAHRARQTLEVPTGDALNDVYTKALQAANEYHRSLAQEQERTTLGLQSRAKAVQSGLLGAEKTTEATATNEAARQQQLWQTTPLGVSDPATYGKTNLSGETPLTLKAKQEAGVDIQKQEQLKQFGEGGTAAAEAGQRAQAGQPGFIQALPADQRQSLVNLQTAYQTLNNLQTLHQNMVDSAWGAGGNLRSTIGNIIQSNITNKYARAYEAYQDETLTPLALGVLGDKAAGATKANIQEQLRGTIPERGDTLESAGNKIYQMKSIIMQKLQAMHDQNLGTYSTGEISNLYMNLNKDFTSPNVAKYNLFLPAGSNQNPQSDNSLVGVGNSVQGRAAVSRGASLGVQLPGQPQPGASPGAQVGGQPQPSPAPTPSPLPNVAPAPNWAQ